MGAMRGQPLTRDRYCRLIVKGNVMMTDAEFERRTNLVAIRNCKGDALVAGLGIGLILAPFCSKCSSVTVVENNEDVISLVSPKYPGAKVVHGDIFSWSPEKGQKFDTIYFDIWPGFSMDDVDEAKNLKKRFRKHLKKGGWMGDWASEAMAWSPRSRW